MISRLKNTEKNSGKKTKVLIVVIYEELLVVFVCLLSFIFLHFPGFLK